MRYFVVFRRDLRSTRAVVRVPLSLSYPLHLLAGFNVTTVSCTLILCYISLGRTLMVIIFWSTLMINHR